MRVTVKWADGTVVGGFDVPGPRERAVAQLAAIAVATEHAGATVRKLESKSPADLGYPDMTPDEVVASEWNSAFSGGIPATERREKPD
jgi:hypothetical protein